MKPKLSVSNFKKEKFIILKEFYRFYIFKI